jgi:hypothetical protein
MRLIAEIIGLWILASCIIGPCLTWLFYYGKRLSRKRKRTNEKPAAVAAVHWPESTDRQRMGLLGQT